MNPPSTDAERDGTQRWFAGLPSVGVIPPDALTDLHRGAAARAFVRARRQRRMLMLVGAVWVALLGMMVRMPGLLCPALPLLILTTVYGPRAVARAWQLRALSHFVNERGIYGTVERFEGLATARERSRFGRAGKLPDGEMLPKPLRADTRPAHLRLDVLVEVGLVIAVDGHAPTADVCQRVQTTSDRLAGTEQGATRPLAANERVELPDLARHDPTWRALLPGAPALIPVFYLTRSLFGWLGMWVAILLTTLVVFGIVVWDVVEMRRRRRYVEAAQEVHAVLGGVNREGEQVEVLLPDKLLWTVNGRPSPERLRERSRALSDKLGDRHAPTTF